MVTMEIRQCSQRQSANGYHHREIDNIRRTRKRSLHHDTNYSNIAHPSSETVNNTASSLLWDHQVIQAQHCSTITFANSDDRSWSCYCLGHQSSALNLLLAHLSFCFYCYTTSKIRIMINAVTTTAPCRICNTKRKTKVIDDTPTTRYQSRQTAVSSSVTKTITSTGNNEDSVTLIVTKSTVKQRQNIYLHKQKFVQKRQCHSRYSYSTLIALTWWFASFLLAYTTTMTATKFSTISNTMVTATIIATFPTATTNNEKYNNRIQQKPERNKLFFWQYRRRVSSSNYTNAYYSSSNYSSSSSSSSNSTSKNINYSNYSSSSKNAYNSSSNYTNSSSKNAYNSSSNYTTSSKNSYYSNSNYTSSSKNANYNSSNYTSSSYSSNNRTSSSTGYSNSSIYTTTYAANNSWTEVSTNSTNTTTTSHVATNNNVNKGYQRIESFCSNNYIKVQTLQLLCDSPFAYYYGSNAYRHSEVCQSGDRANIEMDLFVHDRMIEKVVYVQIEFGLYDEFQIVNTTSLCSLNTTLIRPSIDTKKDIPEVSFLNATNNTSNSSSMYDDDDNYDDDNGNDDDVSTTSIYGGNGTCLNVSGIYRVSTYYTVPKIRDNTFHYTPDIRIRFLDEQLRIVGCTVSGPYSLQATSDTRSTYGLIALAFACSIFLTVFGTLLYKATSDRNHHHHGSSNKPEWWVADDLTTIFGVGDGGDNSIIANENENNNITNSRKRMAGKNKKQQHLNHHANHYFRTLPNGQVLSLPIVSPATTMTTLYQQDDISYHPTAAAAAAAATTMMVAHPPYCSPSPAQGIAAFSAYVPSNQHPFFYKSPRLVVTATRRIAVPTTATATTTSQQQQQPLGVGVDARVVQQQQQQQNQSSLPPGVGGGRDQQLQSQIAPYLLNIPTNNTTSDEDDDDDSDDDNDRGHVTTNPLYNETQLPTRPVI